MITDTILASFPSALGAASRKPIEDRPYSWLISKDWP
jgi:hypothetical protein